MLPVPTQSALLSFGGCAALFALGVLGRSPAVVVLGGSGLLGLATALALTMPLANRMRRERLEFAWWHGHAPGQHTTAVTAGAPYLLRCYVRNRSGRDFQLRKLQPALPDGTVCTGGAGHSLPLPAGVRVEFELGLTTAAAGRVVAQGLSVTVPGPLGLFEAPLYFPTPLTVKVLPRAGAGQRNRGMSSTGLPVERPGRTLLREHGGGTELRELRELQPGDPYKSIAWKASARRGKLLVREVEREVQETLCIVMDVSGSMRGGELGARKLDLAIELAALKAHDALERGDRVGLLAVDGRIVAQVPPGEGRKHMLRIYDALLRTTEVVDDDLTAADDATVIRLVARYMRHQDGLHLPQGEPIHPEDLAYHAQRTLRREGAQDEVVASSPTLAILRRYCRQRGIALPYRADTRDMGKAAGLAEALKQAGGGTRVPRTLIAITDFDGVDTRASSEPGSGGDTLQRTLRMLRSHRHALAFMWPDPRAERAERAERDAHHGQPTADTGAGHAGAERALRVAYGLEEQRRAREAKLMLGRLGIPLIAVRSDEHAAHIITRVRALVQAA